MSPLTRNWPMVFGWAIGMVFGGGALLIYGWHTHNRWVIGYAVLMFLVMGIERLDNWSRGCK